MNSCLERQVRKSCVCLKSDRDLDRDRQTDRLGEGRTDWQTEISQLLSKGTVHVFGQSFSLRHYIL